jgi:hypothetical protein
MMKVSIGSTTQIASGPKRGQREFGTKTHLRIKGLWRKRSHKTSPKSIASP